MVNILMVFTSCDKTHTGKDAGWYLPEAAHPYYSFVDAGFNVDFAAPKGPNPPVNPYSVESYKDDECTRFLGEDTTVQKLATAIPLKDADSSKYDAIFYVGGVGPVFDLVDDPVNIALGNEFWRSDKVVSAVCHGPAAIVNVTDAEGRNIYANRVATSFSDVEEATLGFTADVPFAVETRIREHGGKYEKAAENFGVKVCIDGKLYTGQNPASAKPLGDAIAKALKV